MTTPPRRPSAAARATRRTRRPAARSASFLERNRNRLLYAGAALIFVILAGMAYLNSTQPAYACTSLFDPTPAPSWVAPTAAPVASGASPAPAVTPPAPGYVQPDQGHLHVAPGTRVKYTSCPPASGKHYNVAAQGPIAAKVYGPDDKTIPEGWVHNLEHGAIVLLYNCGPNGDAAACTPEGQAALKQLYAQWPNSPVCNLPPGGTVTPVITRFDDMAYPYAAVVWDVVLPLDKLDSAAIFDFYARQGERNNPEPQCAPPTATPGPATPTPVPTATTAPTTAPTAAPTTAPASAAPTPAAS
ncbi:MAG TPA: DUF3105 domain-containing protein [Candidatus Limnocylindrales bacterium]|nr:DUF3105 domain-containing protein [Candidatus Limnocylindrales bacterium]